MKQKLILNYNASLGMKYCGEILKTLAIVFIASRLNASSEFIFSRPAKGDGALRALGRNVDAFYALLRGESPHAALCRKPYMVQENGLDSLNER